MLEDASEVTPGSAAFWDAFYDAKASVSLLQRANAAAAGRSRASVKDDDDVHAVTVATDNSSSDNDDDDAALLDHYEWFMDYNTYASTLLRCLVELGVVAAAADVHNNNKSNNNKATRRRGRRGRRAVTRATVTHATATASVLHVLHVGCGSSAFCDDLQRSLAHTTRVHVLNVDVCRPLIARLHKRYPTRHYAIGDCCALVATPSTRRRGDNVRCRDRAKEEDDTEDMHSEDGDVRCWYDVTGKPPLLRGVCASSVDVLFDKGTVDALLSAFAGRDNPNVRAYAQQTLHALRPGGVFFVISINAVELLSAYFLTASTARDDDDDDDGRDDDDGKAFVLRYRDVLAQPRHSEHVESLASHYSCYGFLVVQATASS